MMIQIEWWSRASDDVQWWSRSSDDVQWWNRSSDDPDPVMIQIEWWSRSRDEDDLKMKMTWRCRWRDNPEKKTSADKFCQENTFLVKRECWCMCNFIMYSLVFLIYCNSMFILGCNWVISCPDVPFRTFYNVNKSCQVIVGNPPIVYPPIV